MSNRPTHRCLRGYAFDPSISLDPETFDVNNIVYKVRWEETWGNEEEGNRFSPGPCGEYVEVVDFDPTVKEFYTPVDLNDPYILATDGLAPSESNPQFHQQMVYAVAMLTIQNFEQALGRKVHWSPRLLAAGGTRNTCRGCGLQRVAAVFFRKERFIPTWSIVCLSKLPSPPAMFCGCARVGLLPSGRHQFW